MAADVSIDDTNLNTLVTGFPHPWTTALIQKGPAMLLLSSAQTQRALVALALFHILIITASNYLVQLPMTLFGFHTTWGAFSFPFIFLATDLTVRLFGKYQARRIIALVMLPALLVSYMVSVMFQAGSFAGVEALADFNLFVARIALASFIAYVIGQLLDIQVFDRLRRNAHWWIAPLASTLFGNLADTFAFFSVAFRNGPDAFMAAHWIEIAWVDYAIKLAISILLFLPMYGLLLNRLTNQLLKRGLVDEREPV